MNLISFQIWFEFQWISRYLVISDKGDDLSSSTPIFFQMFAYKCTISGIKNTYQLLELQKVTINLFLPTKFMNAMHKSNML